jgi:hypothetical protein
MTKIKLIRISPGEYRVGRTDFYIKRYVIELEDRNVVSWDIVRYVNGDTHAGAHSYTRKKWAVEAFMKGERP